MSENKQLTMNLNVKQREYLKLIEETRNNLEIIDQFRDGIAPSGEDGEDSEQMKQRIHLLAEENHILFE